MSIYIRTSSHPKVVGIAQALEKSVKDVFYWDPEQVKLFDLLEDVKPQAVFLQDAEVEDGYIKYAKQEYPRTSFVWFRNNIHSKFDSTGIDLVIDLHEGGQYDSLSDDKDYLYLPYLANTIAFSGGTFQKQYETDFLIFSDGIPDEYKEDIIKWLDALGSKYRIKIYGTEKLSLVYYLGRPMPDAYKDVIASCKAMIMWNDEWFYTTVLNNKIPIIFQQNRGYNFSSYHGLEAVCYDILLDRESLALNIDVVKDRKTYLGFSDKIRRRLSL